MLHKKKNIVVHFFFPFQTKEGRFGIQTPQFFFFRSSMAEVPQKIHFNFDLKYKTHLKLIVYLRRKVVKMRHFVGGAFTFDILRKNLY